MPTPTYELIESVTLATTASSVTFSSLPQSYGDLVLVLSPIAVSSAASVLFRANSDSGANYHSVGMYGTGSSAVSFAQSGISAINVADNRTSQSVNIAQIMDYSATDKHKTLLIRKDNGSDSTLAGASRWANNAAITSFSLSASNTFDTGSTFHLYGIAKAL